MKTNSLKAVIFMSIFLFLFSCSDNQSENLNINENEIELRQNPNQTFYIVYVGWDEWGRASRECASWGLCNFSHCWFCFRNSNLNHVNYAYGYINKNDNKGFLEIELKPEFEIQTSAILNKSTFYVDKDIIKDNFKVVKGEYAYDAKVGDYGGYLIQIVKLF
jgi:hypothetical protein